MQSTQRRTKRHKRRGAEIGRKTLVRVEANSPRLHRAALGCLALLVLFTLLADSLRPRPAGSWGVLQAAAAAGTSSTSAETEAPQQQQEQVLFRHEDSERTSEFWLRSGRQALGQALKVAPITERAKNGIIFIGDGMSLTTITAARILSGQLLNKSGEGEQLSFEQLHNVALVKTYNVDQQVPDSAATATAILCGVKANFYTLGLNANVKLNDTNCARVQRNQVDSILRQAQAAGKSTGIVTNTRITHATPAAGYAHTANRRWECDAQMPRGVLEQAQCKDIARQLVEDEPGSKLNVIMGGGRRCFFGANFVDPGPGAQAGIRQDGRNLIEQWIGQRRANNNHNYAFVNCTRDLRSINVDKTDYLLGLFAYSHMSYEELRDQSRDGEPSLAEMTEVAIKILSKNPLGYLLLVEGGRIDHAHHENVAGVALRETIALSWAVQTARNMVDPADTLLGVTADHAHALTINGLAPRGNPILGLSYFKEHSTQLPYTTLIYGNGPGGAQRPRPDPSQGPNSTDSPYYVQHAAIHQEEAFHDGSDVAIFASGPYAHLFQGVQEQSYIAHVYAYALCIGDYANQPHCKQQQADRPPVTSNDLNLQQPGTFDSAQEASQGRPTVLSGAGPVPFGRPAGFNVATLPDGRGQQAGGRDRSAGGPPLSLGNFPKSAACRSCDLMPIFGLLMLSLLWPLVQLCTVSRANGRHLF